MHAQEVTNQMLYNHIEAIHHKLEAMDRRFKKMENKLEEMDRRFTAKIDRLDAKVDRLDEKLAKNTERIDEIYLSREKVKVTFSRTFAAGTGIIASMMAYIVWLFTGSYIVRQ